MMDDESDVFRMTQKVICCIKNKEDDFFTEQIMKDIVENSEFYGNAIVKVVDRERIKELLLLGLGTEKQLSESKAEIEKLKYKCNKQAKWITDNIDKAKRCSLTQHDQAIVIHGLRQSNADLRKNVQILKSDRDTWEKSCELACETFCTLTHQDMWKEIQEIHLTKQVVNYFYQKAKEGK